MIKNMVDSSGRIGLGTDKIKGEVSSILGDLHPALVELENIVSEFPSILNPILRDMAQSADEKATIKIGATTVLGGELQEVLERVNAIRRSLYILKERVNL